MVGDTIGVTTELSLYQLTMMAAANGTFVVSEQGTIQGAFHYPLAELAERLGMRCRVMRTLGIGEITEALAQGMYAILSISAAKVDSSLQGGHLVLVYGYDEPAASFLLHDCSSMMRPDGCGVRISAHALASISNNKGLVAGRATVPPKADSPVLTLSEHGSDTFHPPVPALSGPPAPASSGSGRGSSGKLAQETIDPGQRLLEFR